MKGLKSKEDIIKHKKAAICKLNALLESFISSNDDVLLKKTDLLAFWLESYSRYISFESNFKPAMNIAYKRGDVVKVDFGFNIGSEYGGLHYAVVLDNNNAHNSPVITVVPLTSVKDDDTTTHKHNVYIGDEIYKALKLKHSTLNKRIDAELTETEKNVNTLKAVINDYSSDSSAPINKDVLNNLKNLLNESEEKCQTIFDHQEQLKRISSEIMRMKIGSIAVINQITTVSKMRILDPAKTMDILAGIRCSKDAMKLINEKVKELYIFS